MPGRGWTFGNAPGSIPDTVNGATGLHEIYSAADPHYTGRVTVPVGPLQDLGHPHDRAR